ncbi:MAG TPA: YdiU family protein [Nannocystaceae bacterium]|nr:YdiU family protein [Nannocystaceae bacterium]
MTSELELPWGERFVAELPGDTALDRRRRQVHRACWSAAAPTPVADPRLVAWSPEVAQLLGLSAEVMQSRAMLEVLAGNRVAPGMRPWAACYGGHQFGNWAGQLGDGRAMGIGELRGEDGAWWELQLKGAGPTPYSRTADGRAVLRSSIREFLCSEAMHHLGIPTTRALALVTTGDDVMRDMLYDGHPAYEPGAIVCRVARSFLRFGNYEIFAHRDDPDTLQRLLDFTLRHEFPELGAPSPETYAAWFREVCVRTAKMIVGWMRVGFVHGVMNTDNMSVLGLTIDYGPYGWVDDFDPDWTPNTTDAGTRRYRFGQQPQVAAWNLAQLARALVPVVHEVPLLAAGIDAYVETYEHGHLAAMAAKIGLAELRGDDDDPRGDRALVDALLRALTATPTDMTIFFRCLGEIDATTGDEALLAAIAPAFYDDAPNAAPLLGWLHRWRARVAEQDLPFATRRARMHAVNPRYVLRNYLAQLAIDDATNGDPSRIHTLLDVLRRPYDEQSGRDEYAAKRPEWARHKVGCSMLSCSS